MPCHAQGFFDMDRFIYGRKALVTGATSGIGREIAYILRDSGYTVWGVSRRADEKEEDGIIWRKMDITDTSSIRRVLDEIGDFGILVNAAGFGIGGSAEDSDIEKVRAQAETNYFGTITLTQMALPIMRRNPKCLVVVISSVAARVPLPFQGHYSSTKYALEAHFEALRMEAKSLGVSVAIVEPGDLSTGFTDKRVPAIDSSSPYYESYKRALGTIEHDERSGGSPIIIAKAVRKIVKRNNPPVRTVCGFKYKVLCILMRLFPDRLTLFILSKMYRL